MQTFATLSRLLYGGLIFNYGYWQNSALAETPGEIGPGVVVVWGARVVEGAAIAVHRDEADQLSCC